MACSVERGVNFNRALAGRIMTENSSKESVLVTGATGFVGRNLVDALLNRGYAVRCLVRGAGKARELEERGAQLVLGDINDARAVRKAAGGVRTVFHLAALIKAAGREDYVRVNQTGTRILLEALAEVSPDLTRFIHMSSLSAAGPSRGDGPLVEEEKPRPVSWYGESKLLSEEEVRRFAGAFPVTVLRPSAVYGPYDTETLLIFRMVQRGCLVTPGRFIRRFSLIHVRDLVSACIRAAECPTPSGEVFFISRPEVYTWGDVGRTIADKLGKKYRQCSFPRWIAEAIGYAGDLWAGATGKPATLNSQKIRELLQPSWTCNPTKAKTVLGFSPEIDLDYGMNETARWYKSRGWL